jgi:hypothetical protein
MPVFRLSMTASVSRRADGTLDFDPYALRRQLSELWQTNPNDVTLNITATVIERNGRVLSAVQGSASTIFNVTILRVNPLFETCDVVDASASNSTDNSIILNGAPLALATTPVPTVSQVTNTEYVYVFVVGSIILLILLCLTW